MSKEQEGRNWPETIRNGGIIAGFLGLLVSEPLAALGFLAAVGGEVWRRVQKGS